MNAPDFAARVWYAADVGRDRLVLLRSESDRRGIRHEVIRRSTGGAPSASREALPSVFPCVACLPIHQSITRWIRAPLSSVRKARKVMPSQLDIQLPFPLEECVYEFLAVGATGGSEVEGLAVVARDTDLVQRLDQLREWGLDPVRVDHEGLCLWTRSLAEAPAEAGGLRVVASLEADRLALAVGRVGPSAADHRLLSAHSLRPVPDVWASAAGGAVAGTMPPFLQRVRQVLEAQGAPAEGVPLEWYWTGPMAEEAARLEEWEHHVKALGPIRFMRHDGPGTFLARAMTDRALQGGPLACNLRRGKFLHPAMARHETTVYRHGSWAIAAAGLALCLLGLAFPRLLDARVRSWQDRVERMAAPIAGSLQRGQEVLLARRAVEAQALSEAPFLSVFAEPMENLLADMLRTSRQSKAALEFLALGEDVVSARGTIPDWDQCERLGEPLKRRGYSVKVERQDAGTDEKVHFSLQGGRTP